MDQFNAARLGRLDELKRMLTSENMNAKDLWWHTVLHEACVGGHVDTVTWLLAQGAAVDARTYHGMTPLWCSVNNGHVECARALCCASANVKLASDMMTSPLHQAAYRGFPDCVRVLLEVNRAMVHEPNQEGSTPLHCAAASITPAHMECCKLLLEAGSNVQQLNDKGFTAVRVALSSGNDCLARMLLLDWNAQLDDIPLSDSLEQVPSWALQCVSRRDEVRLCAWAVLELKKRGSHVIGSNGRDMLRTVARLVWQHRYE